MQTFPPAEEIRELIQLARREDLGTRNDDVTSRLLVPEDGSDFSQLIELADQRMYQHKRDHHQHATA